MHDLDLLVNLSSRNLVKINQDLAWMMCSYEPSIHVNLTALNFLGLSFKVVITIKRWRSLRLLDCCGPRTRPTASEQDEGLV